ncbi:V-SNARE [Histoplasma capsulatum G186AR]|uniref:V-SNARE n=2 Tax=Ajellomyces capsulatus TaxID=5037 RepID=C0NGZ0_AJECG|nr:V-SNARE [Histoplasma capsulatum G186AR]EEH09075.1 V-SNARE [Histoplasma capsulatum G186AR]KAG5303609.1 V-SNARE [Histoplasma capsulatum]QSS69206.1 V-SNARE [Histoplasma capsulatum G186AR]
MAPAVEISIPTTTLSTTPSPYTIYNISIRLPLCTFTVQKRYSEFLAFHASLSSQVTAPPPAPLPGKSWFTNTNSNPVYREKRREGLEAYLRAINEAEDPQWRNSSAWRAFLNLPSAARSNGSSRASSHLHAAVMTPGAGGNAGPITDPVTWLDCYRDVKSQLHDARLYLTRRDQAATPQKQHECSAQAKSSLVRVGTLLTGLDDGLKNLGNRSTWGGDKLGSGELRRRKDLLSSARKERDGLENLLNSMSAKAKLDNAVASVQDKEALVGASKPRPGRVLGKETDQTRELDNQGVLQLQKQIMENQDVSLEDLRKVLARQMELGVAINSELEIQNEMLQMVDEDADRVNRKVEIGKKRVGKIS